MDVNEQDLEQLELYLDHELTADQASAVEVRLLAEPALGATLAKLRDDRSVRLTAMSTAFDTDAASIERLVASVRTAQASEAMQLRRKAVGGWWPSRSVLTAAASLAFGLFLGVTLQKQQGSIVAAPLGTNTQSTGSFMGSPVSLNDLQQGHGLYVVLLRDAEGREIGKVPFNSQAEADAFIQRINTRSGMSPENIRMRDESY